MGRTVCPMVAVAVETCPAMNMATRRQLVKFPLCCWEATAWWESNWLALTSFHKCTLRFIKWPLASLPRTLSVWPAMACCWPAVVWRDRSVCGTHRQETVLLLYPTMGKEPTPTAWPLINVLFKINYICSTQLDNTNLGQPITKQCLILFSLWCKKVTLAIKEKHFKG